MAFHLARFRIKFVYGNTQVCNRLLLSQVIPIVVSLLLSLLHTELPLVLMS